MAKSEKENRKPTVEDIITKAVIATRLSCAREPKDIFKATEKRLYAYPLLKAKIRDDREMLEEVQHLGVRGKSKGITRFMRSGVRLDADEIKTAVITDLKASIASDEYETERIEKALGQIADDEYSDIIRLKYFEQKTDEEIAEIVHCTDRTVRARKSALVGRLSVFLYGASALG